MSVAVPVVIGIMNPPPGRAQSQKSVIGFRSGGGEAGRSDARGMIIQFTPGGGIRIVNVSLKGIVQFAYGVEKFQVAGGPGWIDSDRFDILAKPPAAEEGEPVKPPGSSARKPCSDCRRCCRNASTWRSAGTARKRPFMP